MAEPAYRRIGIFRTAAEITTLQQTYKRLDETRYLYESATGLAAQIRVDAGSVVFDYPGGWTRVAQNNSSQQPVFSCVSD
jgi:hypothetical protein